MDIIKTIEEDEEVENLSEDSDVEVEVSWKALKISLKIISRFFLQYCLVSANQAEESEKEVL